MSRAMSRAARSGSGLRTGCGGVDILTRREGDFISRRELCSGGRGSGGGSVDPVSLVVAAVVAGAASGAKDTAAQIVKDGYARLKALLGSHRVDVTALESRPASSAQTAALEETLTDVMTTVSPDDEQELLDAAQALVKALRETPGAVEATQAVGADLARIETEFIRIQEARSTGTAVRMRDIKTTSGIDIGVVEAGIDKPAGPQMRQ